MQPPGQANGGQRTQNRRLQLVCVYVHIYDSLAPSCACAPFGLLCQFVCNVKTAVSEPVLSVKEDTHQARRPGRLTALPQLLRKILRAKLVNILRAIAQNLQDNTAIRGGAWRGALRSPVGEQIAAWPC